VGLDLGLVSAEEVELVDRLAEEDLLTREMSPSAA